MKPQQVGPFYRDDIEVAAKLIRSSATRLKAASLNVGTPGNFHSAYLKVEAENIDQAARFMEDMLK